MAAPRGHPKWGGKVKGTKNCKTRVREATLDSVKAEIFAGVPPKQISQLTPLEGLRLCMQWALDHNDRHGFMTACAAAAPYMHAKLAITDLRVTNSLAEKTYTDLIAEREELARKQLVAEQIDGTAVELNPGFAEPMEAVQTDQLDEAPEGPAESEQSQRAAESPATEALVSK